MAEIENHNKNINDRQQSWLDAQKAARPLYWRYILEEFMRIFVLFLLAIISTQVSAECGCEDTAYLNVDYINNNGQLVTDVNITGRWWPFLYGNKYSSDDKSKMKSLSEIELANKIISDGESYNVVKEYETIPIKTKKNGTISFPFVVNQGYKIDSKNINRIVKINRKLVGCTAGKTRKTDEFRKIITDPQRTGWVTEEDQQENGWSYRVQFNILNEDSINVHFSYDYQGGCA
jgi:hypothetical protein